jgi:hypothetical protein
MCNEFNEGKPLEYKYTDKGGYRRMTKGFDAHGMKEVSIEHYLRVVRMVQEDKEMRKAVRKRGRPKKVHTKYVGDLYD